MNRKSIQYDIKCVESFQWSAIANVNNSNAYLRRVTFSYVIIW